MLEYVNDEGHKIQDQHARMKCFPTPCIEYYAKENKMSVLDYYKRSYDNKHIN